MNRPLPERTDELARRFDAKVDRSAGPDGCWPWTGALNSRGYGSLGMGPRCALVTWLAHRLSHHWWVGPIPDGHHVDHTCHNADRSCPGGVACLHRRCVNPAHLEAVTQDENGRRAHHRRWAGPQRATEQDLAALQPALRLLEDAS